MERNAKSYILGLPILFARERIKENDRSWEGYSSDIIPYHSNILGGFKGMTFMIATWLRC
jgi:hypothetical protein